MKPEDLDEDHDGINDLTNKKMPVKAKEEKKEIEKPKKPVIPPIHSLFDFIFPGGKLAKLCKVHDEKKIEQNLPEILSKFRFHEAIPSVILSGARDTNRGKFLAGISRAAFRCDAAIIDSGIRTGIESFCLRRQINLIGVFPESEVQMPKINPTTKAANELTNGHSQLFMMCGQGKWGKEAKLKYEIAQK